MELLLFDNNYNIETKKNTEIRGYYEIMHTTVSKSDIQFTESCEFTHTFYYILS